MTSIVSINIIKEVTGEHILFNPSSYPVLFLSYSDESLYDELKGHADLKQLCSKCEIFTFLNYSNTELHAVRYNYDTDNVDQINLKVQDLFKMSDIEEGEYMAYKMIEYIFLKMYKKSNGDASDLVDDPLENLKVVYKHLKNVYPQEFSDDAVADLVKTKLDSITRLSNDNKNYVNDILKKILNNYVQD